jgi:hypothetical protein
MRAWPFLVIVLASSGCVGQDAPAPVVCDPLSVATEDNHTLVIATFRNCTESTQVVSAKWCNAPWTPMTVRVVHLPLGRIPVPLGVLDGEGSSRSVQGRFIERCPEDFEEVAPQGEISARIPWNGTFFRDACAPSDGSVSNFTCPTWRALDPGLYDLEAIVWPIDGEPWEARHRVRRESSSQPE